MWGRRQDRRAMESKLTAISIFLLRYCLLYPSQFNWTYLKKTLPPQFSSDWRMKFYLGKANVTVCTSSSSCYRTGAETFFIPLTLFVHMFWNQKSQSSFASWKRLILLSGGCDCCAIILILALKMICAVTHLHNCQSTEPNCVLMTLNHSFLWFTCHLTNKRTLAVKWGAWWVADTTFIIITMVEANQFLLIEQGNLLRVMCPGWKAVLIWLCCEGN